MKTAYFDCFSGISGDMVIGAFIDAGLDFSYIKKAIESLGISGYELFCVKKIKNGISGTSFTVKVTENQPHRMLSDITGIILNSSLEHKVKNDAISIFKILGRAEARIHVKSIDEIHFHEIGAADSIIDICGAAAAFHAMDIGKVIASPVNTGRGYVDTSHGKLPVPAPATAEILKGIPIYATDTESELTTPTGAAILSYYAVSYLPLPEMKVQSIGYGAGTKDLHIPNLLRLYIGETVSSEGILTDEVIELETAIDDMNPEFYSYLFNLLLDEGALDVVLIPVMMKKNRPGHILKVTAHPEKSEAIINRIFTETSTSGLRIRRSERRLLARRIQPVETPFGIISVKIHEINGRIITVSPEYEECRIAAIENDVPLKEVYNSAMREAQKII